MIKVYREKLTETTDDLIRLRDRCSKAEEANSILNRKISTLEAEAVKSKSLKSLNPFMTESSSLSS